MRTSTDTTGRANDHSRPQTAAVRRPPTNPIRHHAESITHVSKTQSPRHVVDQLMAAPSEEAIHIFNLMTKELQVSNLSSHSSLWQSYANDLQALHDSILKLRLPEIDSHSQVLYRPLLYGSQILCTLASVNVCLSNASFLDTMIGLSRAKMNINAWSKFANHRESKHISRNNNVTDPPSKSYLHRDRKNSPASHPDEPSTIQPRNKNFAELKFIEILEHAWETIRQKAALIFSGAIYDASGGFCGSLQCKHCFQGLKPDPDDDRFRTTISQTLAGDFEPRSSQASLTTTQPQHEHRSFFNANNERNKMRTRSSYKNSRGVSYGPLNGLPSDTKLLDMIEMYCVSTGALSISLLFHKRQGDSFSLHCYQCPNPITADQSRFHSSFLKLEPSKFSTEIGYCFDSSSDEDESFLNNNTPDQSTAETRDETEASESSCHGHGSFQRPKGMSAWPAVMVRPLEAAFNTRLHWPNVVSILMSKESELSNGQTVMEHDHRAQTTFHASQIDSRMYMVMISQEHCLASLSNDGLNVVRGVRARMGDHTAVFLSGNSDGRSMGDRKKVFEELVKELRDHFALKEHLKAWKELFEKEAQGNNNSKNVDPSKENKSREEEKKGGWWSFLFSAGNK